MAIRLRGNLALQSTSSTAFDIIFTDGIVYDIDAISRLRDRSGSSKLVIEVKDEEQIQNEIKNTFQTSIQTNINGVIDTETTKKEILSIINEAKERFKVSDVGTEYFSSVVLPYIKEKVTAYLNSLYTTYELEYDLTINETTLTISYKIASDSLNAFNNDFLSIYNEYYQEYEQRVNNVDVGGLAISNKDIKINIQTSDYEKYLLSDEKSKSNYSEPGAKKPLVIWTEMTDDETVTSNQLSVLEELDILKEKMKDILTYISETNLPNSPIEDGLYGLRTITSTNGSIVRSWEDITERVLYELGIVDGASYNMSFLVPYDINELDNGTYNITVLSKDLELADGTFSVNLVKG